MRNNQSSKGYKAISDTLGSTVMAMMVRPEPQSYISRVQNSGSNSIRDFSNGSSVVEKVIAGI